MTILLPQSGAIPAPTPSELTEPYWEACARGELLYQRCGSCGRATHTPAYLCAHCTSPDLAWERSAGTGSVLSWTTVWRPQTPAFTVPYVAIIVELDEGWQLLSNLIACSEDAAEVGLRVEVEFHPVTGGFHLPYFRPLVTG